MSYLHRPQERICANQQEEAIRLSLDMNEGRKQAEGEDQAREERKARVEGMEGEEAGERGHSCQRMAAAAGGGASSDNDL